MPRFGRQPRCECPKESLYDDKGKTLTCEVQVGERDRPHERGCPSDTSFLRRHINYSGSSGRIRACVNFIMENNSNAIYYTGVPGMTTMRGKIMNKGRNGAAMTIYRMWKVSVDDISMRSSTAIGEKTNQKGTGRWPQATETSLMLEL